MERILISSLLFLTCGLTGCKSPPTQIVLVVDSDLKIPQNINTLEIKVFKGSDQFEKDPLFFKNYLLDRNHKDAIALPGSLALTAKPDSHKPILIMTTGKLNQEKVVERKARLPFVTQRALLLDMSLLESCAFIFCSKETTCINGQCVGIDVNPDALPDYQPNSPLFRHKDLSVPKDSSLKDAGGLLPDIKAEKDESTRDGFEKDLKGDAKLDALYDAYVSPFCSQHSTSFYCNDFNASIDSWTPTDDYTPSGFVDAKSTDSAFNFNEYWSPDLGDGDRCLSVYRTSNTSSVWWQRTFINSLPKAITDITLTFDVKAPAVRFQGTEPLSSDYGIRKNKIDWWADGSELSFAVSSPELTNEKVPPSEIKKWLSVKRMDDLGLHLTQYTFSIPNLNIAPQVSFTLKFGQSGYSVFEDKHMQIGIDNLVIDVKTQ